MRGPPGCGSVGRTETAAFIGWFDPTERLFTGDVTGHHLGRRNGRLGHTNGVEGCAETTLVQEPETFRAKWLFDPDANMRYVMSDLCVDDPVKRIGWFSVTDGIGLVGPPVDRLASDDMATPRCVVPVAGDQADAGALTVKVDEGSMGRARPCSIRVAGRADLR